MKFSSAAPNVRPSIATRLTIALIVAVTAATLLAGGWIYYSTVTKAHMEIETKAAQALAHLDRILGLPLWNFDDAMVVNVGRTLMADSSYGALAILDPSGRVIFAQERESGPRVHEKTSIVTYQGNVVGHVRLAMTGEDLHDQTRGILITNGILLALILTTITVCTVMLIRRLFQRPVEQLTAVAESYGAGRFDSPGGAARFSEFQPLLDALAGMRERITSQIAELREREERYRELVESANSIILRWQPDGRITFLNPFGLSFFGYGEEEILGRDVVGTIVPAEESTTGRDLAVLMEDIRRNPEKYRNNENENMKKSGERVWVAWTNRAIVDGQDRIREILSIGNDITEKKRLEEQLMHAQKLEAIGTLAGGIAHDFNNLLMAIQGNASLLMMNMSPRDPGYERMLNIEEQVQSGANLTRQLLGFARGGTYELRAVDMNDVIEKTAAMFSRTRKEIGIHRQYARDLWPVAADRGQMEQVLMNLLLNAAHAMPGGGDLYLRTENAALAEDAARAFMARPGEYVMISVTDTGTGMDEQTRQRIFDPFFTTKEMGRGTGLGLAMVYGIVRAHDGFIHVTSERGRGSAFVIHLPASPAGAIEREGADREIVAGEGTILLVDDERNILEVTGDMLESLGYRVIGAGSGLEALERYREHQAEIALVILDMVMPGMSGGEVFDRLREIDPGVGVLLSSGYSMAGQARDIIERGCRGFLQKPYDMSRLSRKVAEAMRSGTGDPPAAQGAGAGGEESP
jgi:PAS domain S-box-containing protein